MANIPLVVTPAVLGELGSIASVVGLPLSLIALVFAIYHLLRLRGETRAARDASRETQRLMRRESAGTDLTRLNERLLGLMELHRSGDRIRALERYPELRGLLREIRRQHPGLSGTQRRMVQESIAQLGEMQSEVEQLEANLTPQLAGTFNRTLLAMQDTLLIELEDALESPGGVDENARKGNE